MLPQGDVLCPLSLDGDAVVWFGHEPAGEHRVDIPVARGMFDIALVRQHLHRLTSRSRAAFNRIVGDKLDGCRFLVACMDPHLRWLAKQVASFLATCIEGEAGARLVVSAKAAMGILTKGCRTDAAINVLVGSDITDGSVRNASLAARTQVGMGRLQVGQYTIALKQKAVKYLVAGRRFFGQVGSIAISADHSRVGQRNTLTGFMVARRGSQTKAMWMVPQACHFQKL